MLNLNTRFKHATIAPTYLNTGKGSVYVAHVRNLALCFLALFTSYAMAQETDHKWGISPFVGVYQPNLDQLNKGEFLATHEGTADIINPDGNNSTDTFVYADPLPPLDPGSLTGIEFQYLLNDKHTVLLGFANWEATSSSSSVGLLPVQGNFETINAERKVDFAYLEYFLGWRYNFFTKPKKYRFYTTASLHHIYDVDYREQFTMIFTTGPARTFRKSIIQQSQATGMSLIAGSAGAELFFTDWFSLTLEAGYRIGLKQLELTDNVVRSDVLPTDNLRMTGLPMLPGPDGSMAYKTEPGQAREDYKKLELDFNGWDATVKATIYF